MPDRAGAVVGREHASVIGDGDTYRPAPDLAIFRDETGKEVFVAPVGMTVVHGNEDDFVACTVHTVPGAVLGGEGVAVILFGEITGSRVKSHLKRSHVGLKEDVGSDHLGGKIDALAVLGLVWSERGSLGVGTCAIGARLRQARILVTTHVIPRPSVEAAFLDGSDIVGDKMIAQVVAFIG